MEFDLTSYKNKYSYKITCCNEIAKVTKFKEGRCWVEIHFKCKKCNTKAYFKSWHYESYIPTKEEKQMGSEREYKRTNYLFKIKK